MSDEARIKSGADLGAVISKVYSSRDSEDTKMFLYVSVSDSREARVKKLFSQEGETPVELVAAATQTVFEMIKEYGSGYDERIEPNELDVSDHSALSDVYEPDEQDEEFEKEDGKIPVAVKILLIVAIVLFLGVVGYIGAHLLGIGASATNESLTNVTEYAGQAEVREYQTNNQTKAAAVKTEDTALPDETKESTSADTTEDETSAYPSLTAERMSSTAGTSAKVAEIYTTAKSKTVTTAENVKTASSTAADTTTKAATTTKTAETAAKTVKTAPAPVQVKATTTLKADNPSLSDTVFTFTAYGYGHGAGMSQEGANAFARQGKDYKYILDYYFPGTQLKKDTDPVKTVKHRGVTYSLKDYLCSAAGAEAGPSAPLEAIKAQMVAIYTLVLYRGGDVSGANECNGDFAYGKYASLDKACDAVIGEYLTYNGKPIDALFSSSCSGCTASSYSAWGSSSPAYLKGGTKSPETVKVSTYTISAEDFKMAFLLKYPTADFSGKPESWIEIIERDPAKNDYGVSYVAKIKVGGVILKGNEFRSVLGTANLKSHCFTYVVK